jgi:5-methylcytosine-specific restriction endonuclease McrA
VNALIKPLVDGMDDNTKQALILSKKFGRNRINELYERLIYHMVQKDLVRDPTPKQLLSIHGDKEIDSDQQNILRVLNTVTSAVVTYRNTHKTYQAGTTSLRDVIVAATKLRKMGRLVTLEDMKNYIISTMLKLNTVFSQNNKFIVYQKADMDNMDEEVNKEWYQTYFRFFGRGQDGHTIRRVKFLVDNMDKFVDVIQRDKIRNFPQDMQIRVLNNQDNKCTLCGEHLTMADAEADHIVEHSKGGLTEESNLQMLHKECHKEKTRGFNTKLDLFNVV